MLCHLDLSELFVPLHPSGTSKPLWPSSCNTCVRRGQSTTAHTQAAAVPCASARCPRNTRSYITPHTESRTAHNSRREQLIIEPGDVLDNATQFTTISPLLSPLESLHA